MFLNESETYCGCFHRFKQSISFCVTDIQVLIIRITRKPKLSFQNFPNFKAQIVAHLGVHFLQFSLEN